MTRPYRRCQNLPARPARLAPRPRGMEDGKARFAEDAWTSGGGGGTDPD
ncbi:hypothetical protein ACPA9J_24395 [Pseudomonas aeruginosa]